MLRRPTALVLLASAVALGGCGIGEVEQARDDARARIDDLRERSENLQAQVRDARENALELGDEVARKVQEALDDLRKTVPTAGPQTLPPQADGAIEGGTIDAYLKEVIEDVDRYWTQTLAASGVAEPRVSYTLIPPGARQQSGCGEPADDRAAFYCPADDTIYLGQVLAAEVYDGVARGFPGQEEGQGRAVGSFGVAYIVAHEYAHNLQQEFGFFDGRGTDSAKPFELQADCMAGLWGNSVYRAGRLQEGDVEDALSTALAVGDFDQGNQQHHGTPPERRDAWLLGFESGDPQVCTNFVPR